MRLWSGLAEELGIDLSLFVQVCVVAVFCLWSSLIIVVVTLIFGVASLHHTARRLCMDIAFEEKDGIIGFAVGANVQNLASVCVEDL